MATSGERGQHRITISGAELRMPLVKQVGFNAFRRSLGLGPHVHEGFELTYLADGEVTWMVETGETLHLRGGNMAIIQPDVRHEGEWKVIRPCTLQWIVFEPHRVKASVHTPFTRGFLDEARAVLRRVGNAVVECERHLPPLFTRIRNTMEAYEETASHLYLSPLLRSLLSELFVDCVRSFGDPHPTSAPGTAARRAIGFMAQAYANAITVADIARHVNVSPSRFHVLFKRETGQTPVDYLQRLRVARAQEALTRSARRITDVALDCGFSSSQYFAHCFKKYTGMTPREFRARNAW